MKTTSTAFWIAMVLLPCAGCVGHRGGDRPNVILITVDTLRADHLSAYGYSRETSPFLGSLVRQGVRFQNGYSTTSWTVPAVASLLTGLYPETHGVTHGAMSAGRVTTQRVLAPDLPRLAELLGKRGYKTFGITTNSHLSREYGFAEGFDRYENLGFEADAAEVNARVEARLEEIAGGAPYFLWVHYFDPHGPYLPRSPWIDEYAPVEEGVAERVPIEPDPVDYERLRVQPDSPELAYIRALYDSEVRFTDEKIREVVERLDGDSEALVVVTSDHGEEFLDHGGFGHHGTLYEELIRVPLIVRFPDRAFAGREIDETVSIVDIAPSILDYLDAGVPLRLQGASFMDLVAGESSDTPRVALSSLSRREWLRIHAIVSDGWKLIRYETREPTELLFRLEVDPDERDDVAMKSRWTRVQLAERLDGMLAGLEPAVDSPEVEMSAEQLEDLRSLGYVQ